MTTTHHPTNDSPTNDSPTNDSPNALTTRDILTAAAMLVLAMAANSLVGSILLPIPFMYLYVSAAGEMFLSAIFFTVAARRIDKHGLFLIWVTVQGLVYGLFGYPFLIPYFLALGALCELTMIGAGSYRSPLRIGIGWSVLSAGMVFGNAIPLWFAWDSFTQRAATSGFSQELFDMQVRMVHSPLHICAAMLISIAGGALGIGFADRIMRRHFRRARIVA